MRVHDSTVIIFDTKQSINRYYSWFGEFVLGFWRVYSTMLTTSPWSCLPFLSRYIFPLVDENQWRDAGIISRLMRAVDPSVSIETSSYWKDLIDLNRIVFKRVALINRATAETHPHSDSLIGGATNLDAEIGFWEPFRINVLHNMLGYIPAHGTKGSSLEEVGLPLGDPARKPIVIYFSRPGMERRRLSDEAHESLVFALRELEKEGIYELYIPDIEKISLSEQLELAAKTTIMLGVHGDELTHRLWMPSTRRSAVVEIFVPDGKTSCSLQEQV
ncbi:hypothetical protein BT96DRAFT_1062841 [Gymnopus androsaceus JB14]|uniref:Glycosyltransferase 61 catalytic domain-containing protein n=1 Tax=Gymnopus androsaceus JB14 TaxID=1447944 RepID=A0A6A4I4W7_9AGAR|nr:hypothetical protein BT96DRAFT_1062841 [Gymnopus androsaceus JB14]